LPAIAFRDAEGLSPLALPRPRARAGQATGEDLMSRGNRPVPISRLAAAVQPSATLAAGALARQLRAQGVAVFDFSLGEPDFPTPEHICAAAARAMREGQTHYTPASGTAELRGAVARWYQKTYGIGYSPEQVIISNGAKHSLHTALAALVGPGDE